MAVQAQAILLSTRVCASDVNALAPTLKISANLQASAVFLGRQSLDAAAALLETLMDIASGALTWGEVLDEGDEVLRRFGMAL